MEKPFHIIIGSGAGKKPDSFWEKLSGFLMKRKLGGPGGFIFLLSCSVFFAYLTSRFGVIMGGLILVFMVGLPVAYGLIAYPKFGIIVFLICAFLLSLVSRLGVSFPLGTLMDLLEALFILSIFIQQKNKKEWALFKGPISGMVLLWIFYNLMEVINPVAESRLAWVYSVRAVALIMLMYFIFLYNIRTKEFIKVILKLWIGLAFFAALYGLKQEFLGLSDFELKELVGSEVLSGLYFIDGRWRLSSIFSDPVAFSYNMVTCSALCLGLLTGPLKRVQKIILAIIPVFLLWSMLYSGTRGAFALPPVVLIMFVVLKFNKQIMAVALAAGLLLTVLVFVPTSNSTLYRFQTTFRPSDDASFNVRKFNQKLIQPYIQSHPFGGGLGATGMWGQRFAPNSYLAKFPPDSGYVRVAVELGWVGLFIFCLLIFTILRVGIKNYFSIKDPELKSYCLSMILVVFALHIGNYPQEALVQFPSSVLFYLVTALIVITKRIDDEYQFGIGNINPIV